METAINIPNLLATIVLVGGVIWALAVMIRRPLKVRASRESQTGGSKHNTK